MTDPLLSVVTPSYNQAEFIEDNIASVKNQTHSNIEHIVVDGESTDGTVDILRSHEDEYDLRWSSEPDEGQSDAINKGFDRADGEIVGWLNSDDVYVDVRVFERVIEHFDRTGADVLYGDLVELDAESRITGIDSRPDFDYKQLLVRNLIGQPATFFRREVVEDEQLDASQEYTMDYEYWLRLAQKYEFAHVSDLLAGFRIYEAQKSQSLDPMHTEMLDNIERHRSEHGETDTPSAIFDILPAELRRYRRGLDQAYRLWKRPPEFAFETDVASLPTLLSSIFPGPTDVAKVLERW